ncbi:hypothetical protein WS0957 [Wolinella succinogenes]|uniref:Uncharacterized protein n=1 Tax=Wolinella succinogenes (strain ATCC 29543 / DSM 1740 / CCUG 13145 / JCM 31913 / LMG 7466 / NCTC 11488 / FDC 602W) TaxID=273121 RepID=Q7MRX8_WOLSU|nr:hypothetical protein WS0957 [Wolinella succinogenes]
MLYPAELRAHTKGKKVKRRKKKNYGALRGSRTPNPQIRSLMLYPIEL